MHFFFFVRLSNMYGVPVALVTDLAQHVFFLLLLIN